MQSTLSGDTHRPKRVLLVEINEDGTVGGSHQALFDLATHVDCKAFEPLILFYEENRFAELLRNRGFQVRTWQSVRAVERSRRYSGGLPGQLNTGLKAIAAVARRYRFLRQERVDLVHLNNSPCIGFSDWLPAARLANIPITCHSRGAYFGPASSIGRWLTRRFDAYVAISQYIAANLIEHGAPRARIRQVYDGVALENWKLPPREEIARLRAEHGIPEGTLLVVLVGLIRAWKGQAVALDALARLSPEERQKLRLWIVGGVSESEREYRNTLSQKVADAGLGDTVTFLGHRFDVSRLMAAADVVLHASTIPEPFGLVVLEGLALGKVVIASQLGGPAEVLSPGDGMLFDPSRPEQLTAILSRLIKDPAARVSYEERALRKAQMFDVQQTVEAIERVWNDALEPRRTASSRQ